MCKRSLAGVDAATAGSTALRRSCHSGVPRASQKVVLVASRENKEGCCARHDARSLVKGWEDAPAAPRQSSRHRHTHTRSIPKSLEWDASRC